MENSIRLQKYLAGSGVASRRSCEEIILKGRVSINGTPVSKLGTKVDPENDLVELDGREIETVSPVHLVLNKPPGFLCTCSDPQGRPKAGDLLPYRDSRLFPVGRLDLQSEGIIFFTNDGRFCYHVTHPKFRIVKEYRVWLDGTPESTQLQRLVQGITHMGERLKAESVRLIKNRCVAISLCEGKNREVRRMIEFLDFKVQRLKRIQIGSVKLGSLPSGKWRKLTDSEIKSLISRKI